MSLSEKMDFYKLCRCCMSMSRTTYHLFKSRESRDRQLQFKLKKCIPLQIKENDSLPKEICGNCVAKIEEFYEFINQCVSTDSTLKSYCMISSVSDQCQGKLIFGKLLERNDNFDSLKKVDDSSDHSLPKQSLFNLVQSGSIEIINDINSRFQEICKYKAQPVTSAINEVEYNKYNYTVANNSIQQVTADLSNDENDLRNVQIIHSTSDIPSLDKKDTEMIMNSVNNVIVKPKTMTFQFIKSENDQDSDFDDSISEVFDSSKYMNGILSTDSASTSCSVCGKVIESEEEISLHSHVCEAMKNAVVHNSPTSTEIYKEPPRFSCNVCEKIFKRKDRLMQHKELHTGVRPYSCQTCTKSFSRKEHLIRHTLSHTGQRLYGCDLCHKHFSRKDNLQKHRTKHGVTGPFACETCGRSFTVKFNYDKHMATHNEVKDI